MKLFIYFTTILIMSLNTCLAEPRALSAVIIEHWMSSQQAFEAWGKENEPTLSSYQEHAKEADQALEMSTESMTKPLKETGLEASANALVKKHGFDDIEHWADITLRITKAAAAIEYEKYPAKFELPDQKDLINMSARQKSQLLDAFKKNIAMLKQFTAGSSEMDKQAVKPFIDQIHRLMEQP